MGKINILFLVLSLDVGGTERHIINLATHLNRDKFNLIICCFHDLGSIGKQFVSNKDGTSVYSGLIRSKYDLSGILRIYQIIKKEKIHILYTINSPLTQLWGTLLAKLSGIDVFITRVTITKPLFHGKRRKIINRLMLPFVSKVIAQADIHKEYLIEEDGIRKEKIEVVYNGVDLDKFSEPVDVTEFRQSLGIGVSDPVIGILARLSPEKGHPVFLMAAKKIVTEFPDTRFLIVGDGKEREKLESLAGELDIESNVNFLGSRKDIPRILSIIDIAVLSSNIETVSNAVLEYMAASRPVIATNAGSTANLVDDGKTGFLISCGDYEALAAAALTLLRDRQRAREMGEKGRERVRDNFTISKMTASYESLFLDLMQRI